MDIKLNPDKWIENYADYLFGFAKYRLNSVEIAEDLVQDTFVSAFKNADSFKGNASEKTWLTAILKNKIIDYFRKKSTKMEQNMTNINEHFDYQLDNNSDDVSSMQKHSVPFFANDKMNETEQKELASIINNCFEKLPKNWNQICKMKLIDDEETETICNSFNISKNNLWVIIHRSKLLLQDCVNQNWGYN